MGLYPDVQNNIHIICERCIDTLFGLLHVQVVNVCLIYLSNAKKNILIFYKQEENYNITVIIFKHIFIYFSFVTFLIFILH